CMRYSTYWYFDVW
nr:immunoglobulin heavy chain junction region [Mus musculus]